MELTRITKHKKPRYQHLRIGFRPSDSTWLVPETPLDWVNHPEAEHQAWSDRWTKLFATVDLRVRGEKETPLDRMTEAQRVAYEQFSGYVELNGFTPDRYFQSLFLETTGDHLSESSVKFLRERQLTIPRWAKEGRDEEKYDQFRGVRCPAEFIVENEEPIWQLKEVVDQNLANFDAQFEYALENAIQERNRTKDWNPEESWDYGMMVESLRVAESDIQMDERNQQDPEFDVRFEYPGLEATKARFERMLAQALKEFPDLMVEEEEEVE